MHETIFLTIFHLKLYFKWNKIESEIAFEWQTRLIFWLSNFWKWQFVPENVCDRTVILACKIPYLNYGICMRTAEQISQILKKNYLIIYYVKRYKKFHYRYRHRYPYHWRHISTTFSDDTNQSPLEFYPIPFSPNDLTEHKGRSTLGYLKR